MPCVTRAPYLLFCCCCLLRRATSFLCFLLTSCLRVGLGPSLSPCITCPFLGEGLGPPASSICPIGHPRSSPTVLPVAPPPPSCVPNLASPSRQCCGQPVAMVTSPTPCPLHLACSSFCFLTLDRGCSGRPSFPTLASGSGGDSAPCLVDEAAGAGGGHGA